MTVHVYVWLPELPQVGHASLELGDGTYISLWPGEESFDQIEDKEEEERSPDRRFDIDGLDERKIKRWWTDFKKTSWSLLGQNCCKTVIDGLRKGGSDKKLGWLDYPRFKLKVVWTPSDVMSYCNAIS